ncbi:MAG: glycoside hydrolase family 65 protein, partial [Anaerolineae bacterium]|nr:glycoside hydrolase family 65 protein [Anaerolineae bacterium]
SGGILDREMISLPDWRRLELVVDGESLTLESAQSWTRQLDMRRAVLGQTTTWRAWNGRAITLRSERFLSAARLHLGAIRWQVEADTDCEVEIRAHLDGNVYNRFAAGHFADMQVHAESAGGWMTIATPEMGYRACVMTAHECSPAAGWTGRRLENGVLNECAASLRAGQRLTFVTWASVYDSRFSEGDLAALCERELEAARALGFEAALAEHTARWAALWADSDVQIEGDERSQAALRFCIFHLLANAPHDDRVSISARGLQGQDYWGSIYWDCEVYVLPFFIATQPDYARRCLMYRRHTLPGARRKAKGLGFEGAYYAWQSQETGDETCALYVFDDPFTGQKIRSYFADEQIHISADIVYALWEYAEATGDSGFLYPSGLEIALDVARFFASRVTYTPEHDRYELLTVLGPDEYHERIDNNAYTNAMARLAFDVAFRLLDGARNAAPDVLARVQPDPAELARWRDVAAKLYVPAPDPATGLIAQFDGYFDLEDALPDAVQPRLRHPDQHPGGPLGPYQATQSIKQADVVLLLYLLRDEYTAAIKRANWEYYEPRTAHHSSLSPMAYALVAADLGRTDWAYRYFLRTATMDLLGAGPHWNLGVHTAAMGGAWAVVVHGFCGVELREDGLHVRERALLPEGWQAVRFRLRWHGHPVDIHVDPHGVTLRAETGAVPVVAGEARFTLEAGQEVRIG